MISAVIGQIVGAYVVPAGGRVGFLRAHAGMFPAVIFHVAERNDALAINVVKRVQPGGVVEIRNVCVMRGVINHLAIMLRGFERGSKAGARDVVGCNQMDRSFVVFEGASRGIWNINLFAGFFLGIERRDASSIQQIRRWRIGRPFGSGKRQFPRPCKQ